MAAEGWRESRDDSARDRESGENARDTAAGSRHRQTETAGPVAGDSVSNGVSAPAGSGHQFLPQGDPRPPRQRRQRPDRDAAGGAEARRVGYCPPILEPAVSCCCHWGHSMSQHMVGNGPPCVTRPQGREDDDDLHARFEPRRPGRQEPRGRPVEENRRCIIRKTIYHPAPSVAETVGGCRHKVYVDSGVGVLCRNFAAHSCSKETI